MDFDFDEFDEYADDYSEAEDEDEEEDVGLTGSNRFSELSFLTIFKQGHTSTL